MITTDSPITSLLSPPPELVASLRNSAPHGIRDAGATRELWLIHNAFAAGADQELEACCEWFICDWTDIETADKLRAARRPKPPSLKEQALHELEDVYNRDKIEDSTYDTIRRALEALDD